MYSTWLYYAPDRIMFDCGEGVSTTLTNKIFAVQRIFLSHGHADHISGLWGFLNTRNSAMGEREKPLEIYYHKSSTRIRKYLEFVMESSNRLKYEVEVYEIDEQFRLPLFPKPDSEETQGIGTGTKLIREERKERFLEVFPTKHMETECTLGFHIKERRKRLKEVYRNLSQEGIRAAIRKNGREAVSEYYDQNLFTYSGDGLLLPLDRMLNTDTLFHECTFLNGEDRKGENHTSLEEVVEQVLKAKPKEVYLYHISSRYSDTLRERIDKIEKRITEKGIKFGVVPPGKVCYF
jgi:ribonuclease Z